MGLPFVSCGCPTASIWCIRRISVLLVVSCLVRQVRMRLEQRRKEQHSRRLHSVFPLPLPKTQISTTCTHSARCSWQSHHSEDPQIIWAFFVLLLGVSKMTGTVGTLRFFPCFGGIRSTTNQAKLWCLGGLSSAAQCAARRGYLIN